jgi:hypothetical protein
MPITKGGFRDISWRAMNTEQHFCKTRVVVTEAYLQLISCKTYIKLCISLTSSKEM